LTPHSVTVATYTNSLVGLAVNLDKCLGKFAAFFWGLMHLPRVGRQIGRWGEGVSSAGDRGSADPGRPSGEQAGFFILCPVVSLYVYGAVYRQYGAVISRSSDLESPVTPSLKPITC
jgi:hypothetical protein